MITLFKILTYGFGVGSILLFAADLIPVAAVCLVLTFVFELGKSAANIERLRQKFLRELRWFTDILDELRLADTLYRKATDKE